MTEASTTAGTTGSAALRGQTVVLIGGSAGIGLETARLARAEGADVILTGRNRERLDRAASEVGAQSVAAFDATDFEQLGEFFADLTGPIDHVLATGPGPYYAPLTDFDLDSARRDVESHLLLPIQVARERGGHRPPRRDAAVHERHRGPHRRPRPRVHRSAHGRDARR